VQTVDLDFLSFSWLASDRERRVWKSLAFNENYIHRMDIIRLQFNLI